jgi:hypothetical protein
MGVLTAVASAAAAVAALAVADWLCQLEGCWE